MKKIILSFVAFLFIIPAAFSQGLLDELDEITKDDKQEPDYAFATFKGVRLINGHSVEMPAKGEMIYMIAHRFGSMENGFYDMFGLDRATMRMGFEYTLPTDFVCVGIGRSTYNKTYDAFVKAKLFRQQKGTKNFPFTITYAADIAMTNLRWTNPERKNYFSSRLMYMNQLLIARKFNSNLSLQLMPTVLHKNLVHTLDEQNTTFSMGIGGRMKLTNRISINAEYFGYIPGQKLPQIDGKNIPNTFAIGFDIETGGHVFQLQFTNANAMYDGGYITETTTDFFAPQGRGLHFGFNLTRTFSFKKNKGE